jgi:hypothetical protein
VLIQYDPGTRQKRMAGKRYELHHLKMIYMDSGKLLRRQRGTNRGLHRGTGIAAD